MSRESSDYNYASLRSPSKTEKGLYSSLEGDQGHTDRGLHEGSPTRHDVEFYIRKLSRYETEIQKLEQDLSVAKFKLAKAEDYELKYDKLFRDN
jgi:hypothetical protein